MVVERVVHVESQLWPVALVCGRRARSGLKTATLAAARQMPPDYLCAKCRQRLAFEILLEEAAAAPRPKGFQYKFPFVKELEYSYG